MVNLFHGLIFMKVSVERQCSSSTKPITCTIASLASLMYFGILISRIYEEIKVLHNLVIELTSKGLCLANLAFFVMVRTNKDL
jgi:hypothetical protein